MENLHIILSVGATAVGLLFSTIIFVVKFRLTLKEKDANAQHLTVRDVLLGLIGEAEKLVTLSGEQKKEYVVAKINEFIAENGFAVDADVINRTIDEIVALTKAVNAK